LLTTIRKYATGVDDGIISDVEMNRSVLDLLGRYDDPDPSIVIDLLAILPEKIRDRLRVSLQKVQEPGYSQRTFHYGGERLVTDEEVRADAHIRTVNVRRWAAMIEPLLSGCDRLLSDSLE
jgi:hypothetical protein